MSTDDSIVHNPNGNFRTLGAFWVTYGVIRFIMVLCLLIYGRTVTLMFGALLSRVPDPFALMDFFHFLYMVTIAWSAACALIGLVAGVALIGKVRVGRKLALIAAVLSVSDIPLGITLGIYTLVELLPFERVQFYNRSVRAA